VLKSRGRETCGANEIGEIIKPAIEASNQRLDFTSPTRVEKSSTTPYRTNVDLAHAEAIDLRDGQSYAN
jgi:hypothetical protein